jgi:hypothetical protein
VARHEGATAEADIQVTESEMADVVMVMDGGRSRLRVKAIAAEGGEPLEGVRFAVYESNTDIEGTRKKIDLEYSHAGEKEPVFDLPPGDYFIEAEHGRVKSAINVKVLPGVITDANIVMNSGRLRVKAVATEGGDRLKDVNFELCEEKNGEWKRVVSIGDNDEYYLKAGTHHIIATKDKAASEIDVEVKPDELTDATIVMNAGSLDVKVVATKGGNPLEHVSYRLYHRKSSIEGKDESIAGISATGEHGFFLNSGKYHLIAKEGLAKSAIDVQVQPGKNKNSTIVMNAGYLRMEVLLSRNGKPLKHASFYFYENQAFSQGKKDCIAAIGSTAPHVFFLNEGKYNIEVSSGGVKRNTIDVHVTPGMMNNVAIELK